MSEKFVPKISKKELENCENSWDYIYKILDPYFDYMDENSRDSFYENANESQCNLFTYRDFDKQVGNGGFVQMIANGYYTKVFSESFLEFLKKVGAFKTSEIVENVKEIFYEKNYEKFLNNLTFETFPGLYKKMPEFWDYDRKYYKIEDEEVDIIANYIRENISDFIEVTE